MSVAHRPELEQFHSRKIMLERRKGGARLVSDIDLIPRKAESACCHVGYARGLRRRVRMIDADLFARLTGDHTMRVTALVLLLVGVGAVPASAASATQPTNVLPALG